MGRDEARCDVVCNDGDRFMRLSSVHAMITHTPSGHVCLAVVTMSPTWVGTTMLRIARAGDAAKVRTLTDGALVRFGGAQDLAGRKFGAPNLPVDGKHENS